MAKNARAFFKCESFLKFDIEDAAITRGTEKRLTMKGAYEFGNNDCVQLAAINCTWDVTTENSAFPD